MIVKGGEYMIKTAFVALATLVLPLVLAFSIVYGQTPSETPMPSTTTAPSETSSPSVTATVNGTAVSPTVTPRVPSSAPATGMGYGL